MTQSQKWIGGISLDTIPDNLFETYERSMVPAVFGPWASRLVEDADLRPGERVLDVACATGAVAREAARRVGDDGSVTGLDLLPGMLDTARNASVGIKPEIEWVEGDACAMALPDASFDVVFCQQGLQFFPDRAAALAEMRRAARPNARIGIATWGPITDCPMFAAVAFAVGQVIGSEKAERYRSGPWGLTDETTLTSLVESAQFSAVEVRSHTLPVTVEGGTRQLMQTLFTSAVVDEIRELGDDDRARLCEAAATRLGLNSDTAPVESYMTSNITTARA